VLWVGAGEFLSRLARVTIFCGGYGSGKTEIAVNFALHLADEGGKVRLADMDIVNLYFRSREKREELRRHGVQVLVPAEPLLRADMPIIPPEVKGSVESGDAKVVLDVGGDPAGARVLAGMAEAVTASDYASLFVVNSRRPQTARPDQVAKMIREIGQASGVPVTGTVVNSHLIEETTAATIEEGIELAEAVRQRTGIVIAFVAVEERLLTQFDTRGCGYPVMVLGRRMLKPWEEGAEPDRQGP
jgi:hypothetical protein